MNDLKNLPKIELHCHLDGSLDPVFVQEVLQSQGQELPLSQLTEQLRAPDDCASLAEYLQRFDLPIRCLDTQPIPARPPGASCTLFRRMGCAMWRCGFLQNCCKRPPKLHSRLWRPCWRTEGRP